MYLRKPCMWSFGADTKKLRVFDLKPHNADLKQIHFVSKRINEAYSPCNEAYHCCISKIYNFLLKHPEVTLCTYFSQLYHTGEGFPTTAWNRENLYLQGKTMWNAEESWNKIQILFYSSLYLFCNFVCGIPRSSLYHPSPPSRTLAQRQHPHQINDLTGIKPYFRKSFPQARQGKSAVQQNLKAFSPPSLASQQPLQAVKGSLLPPTSQRLSVLFPAVFLPFWREHLYPRPRNIVRHLKMPKEKLDETHNSEMFPSGRHLL
ncbi:LOW QUALITY PROTEIN: putative C-_U-editing enzyme APOBEC-4 [Falco peregrinus]|uniref:LOW QUALITY PROTEIN: putative C->U-editing enzyme APOBEC-4 n=1 Tax=Falco peregrinus TaxID=8954 RepID=UPI0024793B5F|nr:LOW QUALITY PROTEIN: putative C->U-editing enzyme APOBEC-4 [Falco peregrinus]